MIAPAIRKAARYLMMSLVLAAMGDRIGGMLLGQMVGNSQFRMSRAYAGSVHADVLVLGDSRGVNAIQAESASVVLGMRVFNLSYNGMSLAVARAVLADYLRRNSPPKAVVLEVTSLVQAQSALTDFRPYAASGTELGALYALKYPSAARSARVSWLFRFNSEIVARAIYYRRHSDQAWTNHQRIGSALLKSTASEMPWQLSIQPENLEALSAIARELRTRDIELRLLVSPYLPAHRAHLTNIDAFMARIRGIVGDEVRVWDYSSAIVDTLMFADRLHMNEQGSLALLSRLSSDGFFGSNNQPR